MEQAFIIAVASSDNDEVYCFLNYGCHPNVRDPHYGQSALSIAAAYGYKEIVEFLLLQGANPNAQDSCSGNTPIMHSIKHGFPLIVAILLRHGAFLKIPENSNMPKDEGWISRIFGALISQCHSGGQQDPKTDAPGNSKDNSTSCLNRSNKQTSNRKRSRGNRVPKDDENESEDETKMNKRPRRAPTSNKTEPRLACPFQKRYPELHKCGPKSDVFRVK